MRHRSHLQLAAGILAVLSALAPPSVQAQAVPTPQAKQQALASSDMVIIGRISSMLPQGSGFVVTTSTAAKGGTRSVKVEWSLQTVITLKGKNKVAGSKTSAKVGDEVILRGRIDPHGTLAPAFVWLPPIGGPVELTASECKDLGGTLATDADCKSVVNQEMNGLDRRRCTMANGSSRCVDE